MSLEERLAELKKWIEVEFAAIQGCIRGLAKADIDDNEISTMLLCDLEDLPEWLDSFEDDSIKKKFLDLRLEKGLGPLDEEFLDSDLYGQWVIEALSARELDAEQLESICREEARLRDMRHLALRIADRELVGHIDNLDAQLSVTAPTTKVVGFYEPLPSHLPYGNTKITRQTPAQV